MQAVVENRQYLDTVREMLQQVVALFPSEIPDVDLNLILKGEVHGPGVIPPHVEIAHWLGELSEWGRLLPDRADHFFAKRDQYKPCTLPTLAYAICMDAAITSAFQVIPEDSKFYPCGKFVSGDPGDVNPYLFLSASPFAQIRGAKVGLAIVGGMVGFLEKFSTNIHPSQNHELFSAATIMPLAHAWKNLGIIRQHWEKRTTYFSQSGEIHRVRGLWYLQPRFELFDIAQISDALFQPSFLPEVEGGSTF